MVDYGKKADDMSCFANLLGYRLSILEFVAVHSRDIDDRYLFVRGRSIRVEREGFAIGKGDGMSGMLLYSRGRHGC